MAKIPVVSVVDDDESVRDAIGALVRSLGYAGQAFASAESFLNSAAAEATDCLIADIQMPGMSGVELQHALAKKSHKLPIIFITAFPADHIRKQILSAGAVCLLTKPYDSTALVKFIEFALSTRD